MKRWVGSTISTSINHPESDERIQVKLSKKFLAAATSPNKNYQVPSTTNDFFNSKDRIEYKMKQDLDKKDDRFVWVDKYRKVGRQKIPQQYLEREAMLKTFAVYQADKMKETGESGFDRSEPVLGQSFDFRGKAEVPKDMTLSSFVSKDSLPYTSQLKRLADMST